MKTDGGMQFPVIYKGIADYDRAYCPGPSEKKRIVVNDVHE